MSISDVDKKYILNYLKEYLAELSNSTIFITGATGFFGKWLLESFLYFNDISKLNIHIVALSRDPEKFLQAFPFYNNRNCITWIKGDVKSFEFSEKNFDYIIHAATDSDSKLNTEEPLVMLDTINVGTRRILEFAKIQSRLKALLFTSSGAVYGKQPENVVRIAEHDNFYLDLNNPGSAYAEGKRLAELYCSIFAKRYSVPVVIARCFAFVGPHLPLDKHYAIGNFINDGLNNRNIIISGDGTPQRSYMYAADLVIWLIMLLLKGNKGEAYNVGSDIQITISGLAYKIAEFFPGVSVSVLNQIRSTDRNQNYVPDVSKFKNQFEFRQNIELDIAIKRTIEFYKTIDSE